MRRDRLTCEVVAGVVPFLAGDHRLPGVLADHAATCLRCQAELARHRRTTRALASLRWERLDPPPGAVAATLAALEAAAVEAARRPAHVGGVVATAAGGAAAVAGVLVWRNSRRRPLAG